MDIKQYKKKLYKQKHKNSLLLEVWDKIASELTNSFRRKKYKLVFWA